MVAVVVDDDNDDNDDGFPSLISRSRRHEM